jgi:hypothetical protein
METLRETPEMRVKREKRDLELINLRNRVRAQREKIKRLQMQVFVLQMGEGEKLEDLREGNRSPYRRAT